MRYKPERALKLRVCGEDLQAQTVTTQAREGIETAHQRYRRSSLAVTTQAREGIETFPVIRKLLDWAVTTQAHEGIETTSLLADKLHATSNNSTSSSACPRQKTSP